MHALLISTYELGHQPFGLASPAAWLRHEGILVDCVDAARDRVQTAADRQSADRERAAADAERAATKTERSFLPPSAPERTPED